MKTLAVTIVMTLLLASCGQSEARKLQQGKTLIIVASTPHLACLANNIAGDLADVQLLPPENANPHAFEPSIKDREKIQKAHLLVVNGLGLEPWNAAKLADSAGATLVDCGKLPASFLINTDSDHDDHGHTHAHGVSNPHVWLSTEGATLQAEIILQAMKKADSANAQAYQKNYDALKERFAKLKIELLGMLKGLSSRAFVSNHDAFPYFTNEFMLNQVGVVQLTPGHNPSVSEREKLVAKIKKTGAKAIFVEKGFDAKSSKAIAEQAGIGLGELDTAAVGKPSKTLIEYALRANVAEVVRILG
ncbi:MAG: metal ABC transporter substrate-binding protein [Planctomycetota bacterium]